MTRKYFGTDGIRGRANVAPMTADMALRVAMATAHVLINKEEAAGRGHKSRAVIGKDTRLSCYMFEQAMAAGFEAMGMNVMFVGPIPTPAVAMLTRSLRADLGVMISASHNPYQDNGIKLFGADGYKLSDTLELEIEAMIDSADMTLGLAKPDDIGNASRFDDARGRYIEFLKSSLPRRQTLEGLKIVVDCANGAGYKIAPQILWELEARVIPIHNAPNGSNINERCGATNLSSLQKRVVKEKADIGIALDGDADRLIVVDEKGAVIDGDQILALLATTMAQAQTLSKDGVVATVMSNLGLERFLTQNDIQLHRTPVGDRYVVEKMRQLNSNLGGEQSGHVVLSDYGTTGDGLLTALQILSIVKNKKQADGLCASEVLRVFAPLPQILKSVSFTPQTDPLNDRHVKKTIEEAARALDGKGRLLVRASGTEPVIRVMAEGESEQDVQAIVDNVCDVISQSAPDKTNTKKGRA
jgi:phosphoglucosamine mutase